MDILLKECYNCKYKFKNDEYQSCPCHKSFISLSTPSQSQSNIIKRNLFYFLYINDNKYMLELREEYISLYYENNEYPKINYILDINIKSFSKEDLLNENFLISLITNSLIYR